MRARRITSRDVTATFFVTVATVLFVVTRTGTDVPGLRSTRVLATVVFVLGMCACSAGAEFVAVTEHGITTPVVAVFSTLGTALLVFGMVAIAAASMTFLTLLVGGLVVLWFLTTLRHVLAPVAPPTPPVRHDERTPVGSSR